MNASLLQVLARYHDQQWLGFHTPGHGFGRGSSPEALAALGPGAYRADLTELDETDNLHAPAGIIAEAQRLAAQAYGADETYFLVNGSTGGLHALILATCPPGSSLLLSRSTHLSTFGALVLAGADPQLVDSGWDPHWQLPTSPTARDVARGLKSMPSARAVLVTRPDYFGWAPHLEELRDVCLAANRPLLVDEAHGAHLGLDDRLPPAGLSCGADAVVQSTHKLGTALTQGAMLHLRGNSVDPVRVRRALRLLQTTSPSYLLLGSLDAAAQQRASLAPRWSAILDHLSRTRDYLARAGLPCLGAHHGPAGEWDPAKLVLDLQGTETSGIELAQVLHDEHHIQVELATPRYLGLIVTPAHTSTDLERFTHAVLAALRQGQTTPPAMPAVPPVPARAMSARDAFLGSSRLVELEQALGEVAAEFVCPYPPGIPALIPGERIDRETLDYLRALKRMGASFMGPDDPSIETLQVCANTPF